MLAAHCILSEASTHIIYIGNHSPEFVLCTTFKTVHGGWYIQPCSLCTVLCLSQHHFPHSPPTPSHVFQFTYSPEETNQLPIFSLSPSLLPYSWVTAPKLLHYPAHTSLRHLKPKLIALLPPILSFPVQGTVIHPGIQLRNVNLWLHSPSHSSPLLSPLTHPHVKDITRRWLSANQEENSHLTLELPTPQSWIFQPPELRNKYLWFKPLNLAWSYWDTTFIYSLKPNSYPALPMPPSDSTKSCFLCVFLLLTTLHISIHLYTSEIFKGRILLVSPEPGIAHDPYQVVNKWRTRNTANKKQR